MVYSKVMALSSPPNPDLPAQTSSPALHSAANLQPDYSRGFGSINMEDILNNIYSDSDSFAPENNSSEGVKNGSKTADEVWKEIVGGGAGWGEPAMTLEVFLAKAGVVNEEDVGISEAVKRAAAPPQTQTQTQPQPQPQTDMMSTATGVPSVQFPPVVCVQNGMGAGGFGMEFGNGVAAVATGGGGRGKRKATVEETPLDKATQQKQRRMIKNRESAARSRERKQVSAYTVELESQLTNLEDENAELLKEEAELKRQRYKQLMENLIPVAEKQRAPRVLRKVHSMKW